ncbi:MAG TPA: MBG domain-containing protein, partial [Vicinamibacterales bacterium]|nr:MBG domain-containing protein [Vicinamibacterales bacterium]
MASSWAVIILTPSLLELPTSISCTATPNSLGTHGGTVQFAATASNPDTTVTMTKYTWKFDDGSNPVVDNNASFNDSTSHLFTQPASFPTTRKVTVTVTDSNNLNTTGECDVQIVNTNVPPTARSGGPYAMCPGDSVLLNGTASSDEDGSIVAYRWIWDTNSDFTHPNATGATVDATAAFTALGPGTYTLGLQVQDNDGAVNNNNSFTTVTVKTANDPSCNQPPVAVNDVASTFSGTPVTINVLANDSDPDHNTLTVTGTSNGPGSGSAAVNGDNTVTYSPNPGFAGVDVFTYSISDGHGGTASATVTVTVTKRTASVTAGSGTKVYGTTDPTLTPTSNGFLAADNISVTETARDAGENVGSYATHATAAGAALVNYDVTYNNGSLSITQATASVTAGSGTKVYGTSDPTLSPTSTGFLAADNISVTETARDAGENVGSYATHATASGAALGNYAVSYTDGSLSITPATPIATATGGTFTYDGNSHAGTCTVTGVGEDTLSGTISYSPGSGAPTTQGTYTVTCSFDATQNYVAASGTATITINRATASVTAGSGTKVYGASDPTLSPTSSGFLAADNISVTETARDAGENVGSYATHATASGAALGNYNVTYNNGSLSITPATPVATATGGTFTYDGNPHAGTCSVTGVGSDSLSGVISYSPGPGVPTTQGTYTVTCDFAATQNYVAASGTATITINRALATVTAGSGTKVYGTADPTLTPTSSGFLAADGISVTETARDAGENVGSYATHATASGAALGNYSVTYTDGTLAITKASSVTTVTCPASVPYTGSALTPCSAAVTGVNLSQSLSVSYSADNVNVGPVQASAVFAGDANHTGSNDSKTFQITQVPT